MLIPDLHVPDPNADEIELGSHSWMMATVIEDDDLMFGGKPLCAWYEEDRQRFSSSNDEEQRRGRQRERVDYTPQQQHQHRHHGKNTKEAKQ